MAEQSRPQFRVLVEKDVPSKTRDGLTLRADVYRPDADGRFPVLLSRLPYDKNLRARPGDVDYFVERGYVVIMQDVRGRFASDGDEYYPLIWEGVDGYDAVEWAAALPWSNGRVGTMGQSYLGITQYLLAPTRPPHLVTCFPVSCPGDYQQNFAYHTGGALELGWRVPNIIFMARNTAERLGRVDAIEPLERQLADMKNVLARPLTDAAYRRLPLMYWADALRPIAPYLTDYLRHPEDGPFWWSMNATRQAYNVNVPMYHVTSWYDFVQWGTLTNYGAVRDQAMTPEARANQRLLIGPWAHIFPYTVPTSRGTGDIDFGPAAKIELHEIQLRWFDYWLKGMASGILDDAPVKIFLMGENTWRDEREWPLARTRYTPWYLHGGGGANSALGDGRLAPQAPAEEPADRFIYDPDDPVPTCGGNTLIISTGVQDQRPLEGRRDVLVYTSETLSAPLEVTGPVIVKLYAASSAPDTDFTAKLVDVRPDGYAQNLADGIIRARYRQSTMRPTLLTAGTVYEFTIDLWAIGHVFFAGHRIRLDITSSNFPRFDRNLNTGEDQATGTRWQKAEQTIFHDALRPSRVILPIIPR
ncbi:MAG TPA: CocE/NonD family hydrolase [Candidatus Binataceae bacterium]|nr:CocE/NonD family hydrolase [Candidatus Binataceae bacterium]